MISALGWDGKPEKCLETVLSEDNTGFISHEIFQEISEVLEYEKFEISRDEKAKFLEIIASEFRFVQPERNMNKAEDPEDNKFLECALAADADFLISGDSDLLELDEINGIEILSASEFLDL